MADGKAFAPDDRLLAIRPAVAIMTAACVTTREAMFGPPHGLASAEDIALLESCKLHYVMPRNGPPDKPCAGSVALGSHFGLALGFGHATGRCPQSFPVTHGSSLVSALPPSACRQREQKKSNLEQP